MRSFSFGTTLAMGAALALSATPAHAELVNAKNPATIKAIEAGGGKIIMPRFRIEGVGDLIFFQDTEGNVAGAMQYDKGVWDE